EDRAVRREARRQVAEREGHVAVAPGVFPERRRIDLEFDEVADRGEGVAEEEASALEGAEQVADHREAATLDAGEVEGGAAGPVDATVDGRGFEIRIDLLLDADELTGSLQVGDTCTETAIAHDNAAVGGDVGCGLLGYR